MTLDNLVIRKRPSKKQMLDAMVQRTGLNRSTIQDLLKKGWTYKERLDGPSIFEDPSGSMKR